MKKLHFLVLSLILTTGIFAEDIKINVAALKGPTGLSMVNLIHGNKNFGDNTKVEYSIVNTPQLVTAGLLSGSYDIAALPTNLAAIIFNKKSDYELAAVTGNGTLYVISSRDDIKTWKDLKGKKVYNIARSSTPGFLFNNLLNKNGLAPKTDVDVDYTYNHVALAPMLIGNKVETGILPEPLITKVLLKNRKMKVVLDFQKEFGDYPLSCIVVKKSLIIEHPEVVKIFLKELENSINWVIKNPMEAGQKGAAVKLGVTGPLITKAMPRLNLGFINAQEAKAGLETYYKVLFESDPKSIGGSMPSDDFYMDIKR
ncbi:MAG: ABC transporter substrate-binding protein [Spirochaetaceae bacterium]